MLVRSSDVRIATKASKANRGDDAIYKRFDEIDGSHSFKEAAPGAFIDYAARIRQGGTVFYFNFNLAKQMGLIPNDHPEKLTPELRKKVLETFSIVIINEYDLMKKTIFPKRDMKPGRYMATRYLQLQHPNKKGKTSGDGRGIWNGEIKHKGVTWDVSSSGTGATQLSPAHAQTKQFYKTGDSEVGYGNGYNYLTEGLSAALMSEIFHQRGIETERTLAIISFEGGSSINVRAGKNLLRPAHFFRELKLGQHAELKSMMDYFIERQISNGCWSEGFQGKKKYSTTQYQKMAEQMAIIFAKAAAQFEAEYIFCWLDWDGDNILSNGGIIDYGSVRQFGLYHYEYRYDDVDRMSTNIPEQRIKARYIVQSFAQIRDFLIEGKKRNIRHFRNDRILKIFDEQFDQVLRKILLEKTGFKKSQSDYLETRCQRLVKQLKQVHSYFEKTKSYKGIYKIEDGVTSDAVFCMRDLHRDLPGVYLKNGIKPIEYGDFIEIMRSSYAKKSDLVITGYRKHQVERFQRLYLKLVQKIADRFYQGRMKQALLEMSLRASVTNRRDRITGDGVLHVTSSIIRNHKRLTFEEKQQAIQSIVQYQVDSRAHKSKDNKTVEKIVVRNLKALRELADGF